MILWLLLLLGVTVATNPKTDFAALHSGSATISFEQSFSGEPFAASEKHAEKGYSFYGIRYGVARRFENSVMNTDSSYLKDPNRPKQGYVCPQVDVQFPGFPKRQLTMNEDCLYLDIYVPPISKDQKEAFPVLFWIHGGGFYIGDKDMYDASLLSADVKAVVVTINYRLGAFGFLSTGDDVSEGNFAIGDIKLALEWTRKHIGAFGGDADKITIFGESAGGALTSVMMLDDNIRGTVQAAIALSGSAVAGWADYTYLAPHSLNTEASHLGCPTEPLVQTVECLKKLPFEKFIEPREKTAGLGITFGPVIDGIHIKGHPLQMIPKTRKSSKKEATFISGYLKEDSSFLLFAKFPHLFQPGNLNLAVVQHILAAFLPQTAPCPAEQQEVLKEIFQFYKISEMDEEKTLLHKLILVTTDLMFGYPSIKESVAYASRPFSDQVPNYHYLISYDPKYRDWGAFHGLDLVLMYRGFLEKLMENGTIDENASASLRTFIRQIAYNGKPDGTAFEKQRNFLNLNQRGKWEPGSKDFDPLLKLWDGIALFRCPEKDADPEKTLIKNEL